MTPQLTVLLLTIFQDDPGSYQMIFDQARAADRSGIDRVVLAGEHVVMGENIDAYGNPEVGGTPGAQHITGPDGYFLEPVVTLSMVAAITTRVRFSTAIMLAALRRPVVLAKQAATLDVLSGGRFDLGVGVGWQREEYEAAGLDFDARGRLLDHNLEVCQALWREPVVDYSSPELSFERIHAMPKPLQPGGVPVWVAGNVKPAAMRRLARFGSGWLPWGVAMYDPDVLLDTIPHMREAVAGFGRDPDEIQIAGSLTVIPGADGKPAVEPTMAAVPKLAAAGVTDIRLRMLVPTDPSEAEDVLSGLVAGFRAVTS